MAYLLLRNNKESGPYDLTQLLSFGLKPYDLIWIEGKSAAWRYASEVAELKPHAPTVEEQPYDRFFKKNTDPAQPVKEEQPIKEAPAAAPRIPDMPVEKKYEPYIPKKSVFVTLPGQQKTDPSPSAVPETPPPVIIVTENPAAAQAKPSSSRLDEIRDMYAKTLQQRKTKIARKSFWIANLKRAAVIASLVCLGVLTGFVIKSNSGSKHTLAQQTILPAATPANAPVTAPLAGSPEPEKNDLSLNAQPFPDNRPAEPVPAEKIPAGKKNPATERKEQLLLSEKQQMIPDQPEKKPLAVLPAIQENKMQTFVPQPVENDQVTGERNRKTRNNVAEARNDTEEKPVVKSSRTGGSLAQFVSVTSNDYQKVAFGGIRNLQLTVTNDSKYTLDKVTVELQYLKPDEKPLRTELIQFTAVSPNSSLTKKIKDTNRGIGVAYRIIDIQPVQPETALSAF